MERLSSPLFDRAKLLEARCELDLSQEQFARKLDVSLGAVGLWERGYRTPSLRMLRRIVKTTGKPIEFFLTDEDDAA